MRFFPVTDPVRADEPDDQVRSFVFMSNLAAQETSGEMHVSVSLERILLDLRGSTELSSRLWVATEDPADADWIEAAGWVRINRPLIDDTDTASLDIVLDAGLQPLPGEELSEQAQTLVDALLEHGERDALAPPQPRPVLHTAHMHAAGGTATDCSYCAVLRARGYRAAHEEIQQILPARPRPWRDHGLSVHRVVGTDFPTALLPGIIALQDLAARDVPQGALRSSPAPWTPERLREQSRRVDTAGTRLYTVLLARGAEVLAMTSMSIPPGANPGNAEQGLSIVRPGERGRGLGTTLKAAGLELLLTHEPQVTQVATSNAVDNQAMLAINRAFGAREISRTTLWEKSR